MTMKIIKNLKSERRSKRNFASIVVQSTIVAVIFVSEIRSALCQDADTDLVCKTPVCYNYSRLILNGVDTSLDPCDDFYEYACRGWQNQHPIPPDMQSWNQFTIAQDLLRRQLRDLLEAEITPEDNEAVKGAKQQYRACMNQTDLDLKGTKILDSIIEESGGWPMILTDEEWACYNVSWFDIFMYYNGLNGAAPLFKIYVSADDRNSSRHILYLDQPARVFGDVKALNKPNATETDEYLNYVKDVAMVFARSRGVVPSTDMLLHDAKGILTFRRALQLIKSYDRDRRNFDRKYNKFTIDELQTWFDNFTETGERIKIDWLAFLRHVFLNVKNISIDGTEKIVIRETNYIRNLMRLLHMTSDRIIINHIQFFFVEEHIRYMTTELKSIRASAILSIMKIYKQYKRWVQCLSDENLKIILSHMYVTKYFPESARERVEKVTHSVRDTLKQQILSSSWPDSVTKQLLVEKLDAIKEVIGSNAALRNETMIIQFYARFNMSTDYLWNIIQYRKIIQNKRFTLLRKPYDGHVPGVFPITVNAIYSLNANRLELPAAILQFPFFSATVPSLVIYPTIGTTAGHEMGHALDIDGLKFDKDGNYKQWISDIAFERYQNETECFVEQYNNYVVKELLDSKGLVWVDGDNSLAENTADMLGVRAAYETFKSIRETQGIVRLPLLQNYTEDQIYFLLFAQVWCENSTLENMKRKVLYDQHVSSRLRVNGPLSNMAPFSEAFNCSAGSFMNRPSKCNLWN